MIPLIPRFSRINHIVFVLGLVCLATVLAGMIFVAARGTVGSLSTDGSTKARIAERFGELPLSFEINQGQTDQAVKFLSHGPGYDLFLTSTEAVLRLPKPRAREGSVMRLKMIGANAAALVEGRDELPGKMNYFTGDDPAKWRRNIRTYRKVYYKEIYQGIDVVYYGNQRELEYDFVVAAGANPKVIKFSVEGAQRIRLDQQGNLLLALKHGDVRLNKPFIYQLSDEGTRSELKGSYVINGNVISFKVRGADSSKPLVIDPVLSYSTYLGGNGNDQAFGIAVDSQGSAYITGTTDSVAFPTTPGAFKTNDLAGAFVTKLDPTGSALIYSTFISGRDNSSVIVSGSPFTAATSIAVDSSGQAYVTGVTTDSDFPLVNPLKTKGSFFKTTDAAVSWSNNSTGLTEPLHTLAIAPGNPNTIYGATFTGPYRSTDAGATWTKLSTAGLGGTFISALAIDPANSLVVYAVSSGLLFKTTDGGNNWTALTLPFSEANAETIVIDPVTPSTLYVGSNIGLYRSTDGGSTWTALNNIGFVVPEVSALAVDPTSPSTIYVGTFGNGLFKTTNGGSNWTAINNGITGPNSKLINTIVIDPSDSSTLYVKVNSSVASIYKSVNGGNSWVPVNTSAIPPAITALAATPSTFYVGTFSGGVFKTTDGGNSWISVNTGLWTGIINVLVADPSNPTILYALGRDVFQAKDAFVTKLNSSGSDLLFSTYFGGSFDEIGNGIAVDASGNIYVTGNTKSTNFPTVNAFQSTPSPTESGGNAFVTKLNPAVPSYVFSTYLGGSAKDEANSIAIDQAGNVYVTGNTASADFPIANAFQANRGDPFADDAFVTKFNSSGSLSYSTYLGGSNTDNSFGIAVDVSGNAYVTGLTFSTNFPTANPIQATHSSQGVNNDGFVTKLNSQGSALIYSTYLGGTGVDTGRGIAVDATGNAYVTGFTSSPDFPLVAGALRTRSEMHKSVDGGASWSNDNYGLAGPAIFQISVHPTESSTVYAGTSDGVFRSTNGGRTWSASNNGLNGQRVTAIVIDPLTPSTVYVAINAFGGGGINGVYKSTDGGNNWNFQSNGIINPNVQGLAIDPVAPTTLYAATLDGIFKTTDGGDNWARTGSGGPVTPFALAVDPHNHTTVYATDVSPFASGIFRSTNAGATWQQVGLSETGGGQFVKVSPHTPGLVFATMSIGGIFKSVDGGNNWSPFRSNAGEIVFDPVDPATLYFVSTPQGVEKSTNGGQTWTSINKGLRLPDALALAIDSLRPSTLYVSTASTLDDDAFVTKINPAGSALIYSTFVGGNQALNDSFNMNDQAFAIAIDTAGNAYITGFARSLDFPTTPNAYQPVNLGSGDAFITKLTMSHIISGRVLDGGGAPVNGAEVVLSDGGSLTSVITESDGAYEFSHLREGGSFTVSAFKPHFTMAPASQTFSNLNSNQTLDFIATATDAPFFTISGQVTNNTIGLSGVTMTLGGSQSGVRITDSNGLYSFEVPGGGNYTVTPSAAPFSFDPPILAVNNLAAPRIGNFAANRETLVVTNTNNHGAGSLREAITTANDLPGTDTIVFNIPGPGVKQIALLTPLPEINDPVVIDASTQPGYAGAPLIELDGTNVGFQSGLVITAGNTTVRGLAIGGFQSSGIVLRSCNNNVIQGNYIGVDAGGNQPRPNLHGIQLLDSSNNVIGGTSVAAPNVISGNTFNGIEISGPGNIIQGNFIGTNAAGTAEIGNGHAGILIFGGQAFTNNLIGGDSAGTGNLISGNESGINLGAPQNTIQGNLIGTDITGTKKLPNGDGILAIGPNILIGGLTPGARNLISGNATGVVISGQGSKLQGNFIGTDITGTVALGNISDGVIASNGALIGGTVSGARNVIAGNEQSNISLPFNGSDPGVTVQGNYIGTDVTGNRAIISSFTLSPGIAISGSNNLIGGLAPEARNVISGNVVGIRLRSANVGSPQENLIQGNLIGLNAGGTGPLPNTQNGVEFLQGSNNILGGTQSGAANKIAFNRIHGVTVSPLSSQNSIRGNSIFSNDGLGIDLGANGVTANDATDADVGANNLQNFPVLTSVMSSGNSTTILGSLKSTPNTTFQIDFYSSAALDPSGNGEGALFFGTTPVTTNSNGDATINVTLPVPLATGRVITATATDPNGNTSEFSAGDITSAAGTLQFSVSSIQVIEDLGLLNLTVVRKGGSAGTLTIDYATTDGTATAGQDYTATSGTLTFNSGETSKNIQIPILDDAVTEPDETFTVALRNAPNLETLVAPSTVVVTIQDRNTIPIISQNAPSVVEGNTGTVTEGLFTFTLSAATGRAVSANYATQNSSAFGSPSCSNPGTDYETISGTISFSPGNTSITIPVKICGDNSAEANEIFRLNLSSPVNAIVESPQPIGRILDDDQLELLHDESGPGVDQAAALDSVLMLRDPFRVVVPEWFTIGPDRSTRVMFFVRGLQLNPGEFSSSVTVGLSSNSQFFAVSAEDVRAVPNADFTQVVIKLPGDMAAGTYTVFVVSHFKTSNTGTIRIAP